jgi:hypothetical protein
MIFDALYESAKRNELLLVDGGFCHWHLRRDGQLTIREIIATKKGSGSKMLSELKNVFGVKFILARCPSDLPSNAWYKNKGFTLDRMEKTKNGKELNIWILYL